VNVLLSLDLLVLGRSTIAALLQRLYEPSRGEIKIGGQDVDEVDVASWLRGHVGVVSQQPNLFDANIAENIRYGASSAASSYNAISDTDIRKAAKAANVHSFIMGLPQGYDTRVGENASLISGGQAQQLQIATIRSSTTQVPVNDILHRIPQLLIFEELCPLRRYD
jgi:ATP-binding cassette subfamily B (MDR/TAP) protein 1